MQAQLWMGSLEPNMTESYIMNAFNRMSQKPHTVKVMRNKYTGEPAGYAFVHFQSDEEAMDAMHKLNGKPIPGTFPSIRFRLNTASRESKASIPAEREFSVWVGDLSPDVDDYSLYRVFSTCYHSIKTAKVILDSSGYTKGYGFVRFGSEEEQKHALRTMNGYTGLGSKPLKICTAVPKPKGPVPATSAQHATTAYNGSEYSQQQYYDPSAYWQPEYPPSNYYGVNGYYAQADPQTGYAVAAQPPAQTEEQAALAKAQAEAQYNLALVDHKQPIDIDAMNEDFLDQELSLWDAVERSHWFPHDLLEID